MSTSGDAERGQVNDVAAQIYEDFFVPALFGQWPAVVLDVAGVSGGDHVLDVGCGTGVLARAAADRVGPAGAVEAVDVNEGMLAVARRGAAAVEWHVASAEKLPFESQTFERVVSQFALMFFADRATAVAEMVRVGRPGGTVTVATWARVEDSPGYAAMVELLDREIGRHAAEALLAPFTIGTEEQLARSMAGSFGDIEAGRHAGTARFESLAAWLHTDSRGWTAAHSVTDE
ncbi:MAG: class I SAM-dependent methyltransferase, partial [Ilumatobacter sp.]